MTEQKKGLWKLDPLNLTHQAQCLVIGLGLGLCIFLLLAGCKPGSRIKTSPTAQPSATSEAIGTQSTLQLTSVIQSLPNNEPEHSVDLKLSPYTHPQDLFSLQIPELWSISQDQYSFTFTDPQGDSILYIDIFNTGYNLDAESFSSLIEARENNKASDLENYVEMARQQISGSNSILITKEFISQGYRKTLATLYQQQGQALFILDFFVDQDLFKFYQDFLNTIIASVTVNPDTVSNIPIYSYEQASKYSNGFFSLLIPPYWSIERSWGEKSSVDTITSPDKQAIIQSIVFDDKQYMSRSIAGELVLSLLRETYTKGITILMEEILADGREKLTWRSMNDGYQGFTTFETSDSALYMVTAMWGNDPEQYYQDILKKIIESYTVIDTGEGS